MKGLVSSRYARDHGFDAPGEFLARLTYWYLEATQPCQVALTALFSRCYHRLTTINQLLLDWEDWDR